MKLLMLFMNHASAGGYLTGPLHSGPVELPPLPQLATFETIALFLLISFLAWPLLRKQKNQDLEKGRIRTIQLAAIAGAIALIIRIYRISSGT